MGARRLRVVVLLLACLCMERAAMFAQVASSGAVDRRFEVASVKPALSIEQRRAAAGTGGPPPTVFDMRVMPGGRFVATMVTLKMLVGYAFDLKDYQIEGGPGWMTADYFDISAIAGSDVAPTEIKAMLKSLLVERFGLRARAVTREAPVHVLTVARSDGRLGPALRRTSPECERQLEDQKGGAAPAPTPLPRGLPTTPTCGGMTMMGLPTDRTRAMMGGTELERLISLISSVVAAPVVDRTGLSGKFDFTLEYMSERLPSRAPSADSDTGEPPPPIAFALQQQLGLELDKQIGPLPVLVIEAAARPTSD